MKRSLIALSTVAALTVTGFAPAAVAMEQELTMLEAAINSSFSQLGLEDINMGDLTLGQLALIKNVVESDDSTTEKRRRIEAILSR